VRDKKNHVVVYDQALFDKVMKEVPKKMKVITVYSLVEQYKINGSLARRTIQTLLANKAIKPVAMHAHGSIYTKA
jgi:small subunit ribosomal protein S25e